MVKSSEYFLLAVKVLPAGAVDLGLSVLWASCNLGASSPEEYGDYYAWGETETKDDYSWSTYKFKTGTGLFSYFSKYNNDDNKRVLDSDDDAAHVKLGGKWRIPTHAECTELENNCTWTWTNDYNGTGVKGKIVTASNGNSIFLPAAGYRDNTSLNDAESRGNYWSSSLNKDGIADPDFAFYVYFDSAGRPMRDSDDRDRYYGSSIRPVCEEL